MELPINKLIAVIILLIILLAAVYLIFGIGIPPINSITYQSQIRECCNAYKGNNCDFKANIQCPNGDFIQVLANKAGLTEEQVNKTCGC